MAARTFTAPDGTVWQAWNVVPGEHSEWPANARRHLPEAMSAGWLCFESPSEKRRLHPIPHAWEERTEGELWGYCAAAEPVLARARVQV